MSLLSELSEQFDRLRDEVVKSPEEGDLLEMPYLVAGGGYEQPRDWDSFFMARHFAERPGNEDASHFRNWVINVVKVYREVGQTPDVLPVTSGRVGKADEVVPVKPFLAQAALKGSPGRPSQAFDWVKEIYEDLVSIVTQREETSQDEKTKLFFWKNAMESGIQNCPVLTNLPELEGAYLACDLNAWLYEEYKALSEVAWAVGNALDAARFATTASNIKIALQEHLWNPELGAFDHRKRDTGCFANTVALANFIPLYMKLGTTEQAEAMFDRYLLNGNEMMTPWGSRSLTRTDRGYHNVPMSEPYSNWAGPVWPFANYLYFMCLSTYGYHREASKMANRIGRLILDDLQTCGQMHESYCSETGNPMQAQFSNEEERETEPKKVGYVGWNLLVQDMLEIVEEVEGKTAPDASAGHQAAAGKSAAVATPAKSEQAVAQALIPERSGGVSLEDINKAFLPNQQKEEEELY